MLTGTQLMIMQFSETQWKSLRYFSFYRLLLALVLFMSLLFNTLYARPAALDDTRHIYLISLGIYFFLSILSFLSVHFYRHYFNWQLSVQVLIDVLVFIVMLHYNDGLTNGFGVILMVTLAGAGLVGQGRLVLFYAAVATLGVLLEQAFRSAETTFQAHDFFFSGFI